jgi:DNA-binding transcriptional LysR family regulator
MDVHGMRVFARVAMLRNISAAASELEMTPGNVSKRLQTLENSLGVRLFDRNTRTIRITEEGTMLLRSVDRILAEIDEVRETLAESSTHPRGTLRVTAPAALGRSLRPGICEFQKIYSNVSIDLYLTDRIVDILEEGYDVAIRTGPLPDSQLIAKKLAPDQYRILASPDYLEEHGRPLVPNDLTKHNCLVLGDNSVWHFTNGDADLAVRVSGMLSSNSTEMLIEAAMNGLGIVRISSMKTRDVIQDGKLVPVLEEYDVAGDTAIWALFPSSRHISPKVRTFLDFFAEKFRHRQRDMLGLAAASSADRHARQEADSTEATAL